MSSAASADAADGADAADRADAAASAVDEAFLIGLARDLVRVRSVFDPDTGATEAACASLVVERLRELGLEPVVEQVAPGRPNVVCDWSGSGFDPARHKTLMFEGHTDVVTEGDRARWSHDPYGAELVDHDDGQRLYGRGSADMKAGVAAAIAALKAVMDTAPDLPGRIRLGIVVDEEGMMSGIKHFIARGWADDVDAAIVCEPEEGELCLFQKGAMRLHVRLRGVMAHGAMPYAGVNPIAGATRFLSRVQALQEAEQARLGPHEHLGLPWFTPTIVRSPTTGEAQHNVMPSDAYVALDVRTVPGQDDDSLLRSLETAARETEAETPGLSIELEPFERRPWTETPEEDPLVVALAEAHERTFGRPASYGGVPGATDGTFLRATAGVPIVTVGPGDRTIPHQVDEFVRVREMVDAARLYAAAAMVYLGGGEPDSENRS